MPIDFYAALPSLLLSILSVVKNLLMLAFMPLSIWPSSEIRDLRGLPSSWAQYPGPAPASPKSLVKELNPGD